MGVWVGVYAHVYACARMFMCVLIPVHAFVDMYEYVFHRLVDYWVFLTSSHSCSVKKQQHLTRVLISYSTIVTVT